MRRQKLEDKTTFDIILDVAFAFLLPMAIAGIWFLANVKWWVLD